MIIECKKRGFKVRAILCNTPIKQAVGLMFRSKKSAFFTDVAPVHMLFCFNPLYLLWLDKNYKIVSIVKAEPFKGIYHPPANAKFLLETPDKEKLRVGDILKIASTD